jgi:hypothetical protein
MISEKEQKKAAKEFAQYWKGKGYEKGQSQPYWLSLLRDVYGVEHPEGYISFEDQVHLDHTSFIDGMINETHVMIEQKSIEKDLNKAIKQSDGSFLTPFEQAKRYSADLPYDNRPRWIITCNFKEFYVYDMNKPHGDPEIIKLEDLPKEYYRLSFLVDSENEHLKKEMEVSFQAGEIVGHLYDAFSKRYQNFQTEKAQKSLNKLIVRIVFCLYAEDAGLFGHKKLFHDYLAQFKEKEMRTALIRLFRTLNTPEIERDPYLADDDPLLAQFPYVNGGLFEDENIEIPPFNDEIRNLLLEHASSDFDWSEISPTIFGAVFESTLNPDTRRSGGMHYTSIENIHKVIDPLFLDDLKAELEEIKKLIQPSAIKKRVNEFQSKLGSLTFLDPAAGSGNFLTESYLSLRKLENEAQQLKYGSFDRAVIFDEEDKQRLIQVHIDQFYGIEINDFAVAVAKTAMWIAEHQMMRATEDKFLVTLNFLPLKSNTHIIEGDSLNIDWENVVSKTKLNYIIGNPPFSGSNQRNTDSKSANIFKNLFVDINGKNYKDVGKLDYVSGWYYKASKIMQNTNICTAFISTNSITQGEQVSILWKPLFQQFEIHIDFAYQSFKWGSEATSQAQVHCVIIGFSNKKTRKRKLFDRNNQYKYVNNINPYLIDNDNVFIERRNKPLWNNVHPLTRGSQPTDDGHLILSKAEKELLIKKEPEIAPYIRTYFMGKDFISNEPRYCLWLVNVDPSVLKKCPSVLKRIELVKIFRLSSSKKATQKKAETPMLFDEIKNPLSDYIAIPVVSSGNRKYIPIGYLSKDIIAGNKLFMMPDATIYDFGILTSNVHMAWMRIVGGRFKSDYSYSNTVVYNNFPWPSPSEKQHLKIENTAKAILDARALYPNASLADLYDELTMPPELRKAHQENDKAVMQAYGFTKLSEDGRKVWMNEAETVSELMKMYQKKIDDLNKK